ncbi:AbfB domain-containing protein [Paenibacillus albidus]|uniref:AbfB domain-containing protein n=1 Tax=Paenibacillus albidus TaxID=2041023 RepID=UPI001BEAFA4F|nr:AbfB domain-containing protein [Paenibacillus albidus]MBT2288417.1 AbfB domain-containing protein [Paenibacillus albidus]
MSFIRIRKNSKFLSVLVACMVLLVTMSVSFPSETHAATTLKTYAAPSGAPLDTKFNVKVRVPGGAWIDLDEYQTRIGAPSRASFASFVTFDCNGPVEMSVTYNSGTMSSVKIRPSAKNITPSISGNTATFTISGPMKLVLDVNDNVDNDLMIFANPLETNVPSASGPNVIYYGPGNYTGNITVPSGKTLYLAGGAVVKGGVIADDVNNVTIRGRGILFQPDAKGISVDRSSGVTIEGIIINGHGNLNNGGYGIELANSSNVNINNVKVLAYKKWTDGIDIMASKDVSINDVYVRTGDDAIAIYASPPEFNFIGSTSNISVTNSVLMNGLAHPINIGTHGNYDNPDRIDNLTFSNIDVLTHNPLYAVGYISVTASDENMLTNVMFTDIRWEDVLVHKFIDIITYKNAGYSKAPGRGINGITIKNFSYNGTLTGTNQIYGNSSTRITQNVFFENLKVNGNIITSASTGNFAIGNYTSNINFVPTGGANNRIQSYNFQNMYVRHQNSAGRIDANVSPVADSQWKIVPGLADPTYISFESVNYPGYYLRHSDYNIVSNQNDGTSSFAKDATFRQVTGLADSEWSSFQSYNYPDRYIRHSNNVLYIQTISTTLDKADATFKLVN